MKLGRICRIVGMLFAALAALPAYGAAPARTPAAPPLAAETKEEIGGPLQNMKFRNLGPAVGGGRVSSVVGIPGDPNVIYVGAAAGGVWKSVDGGNTFKAIFEKYPASIGAIAMAPIEAGYFSKIGLKETPPSVVFQTPPDAEPT